MLDTGQLRALGCLQMLTDPQSLSHMSGFLHEVSPICVPFRVPPLVHSTQEAEMLAGILHPIAVVPLTLQAPDHP